MAPQAAVAAEGRATLGAVEEDAQTVAVLQAAGEEVFQIFFLSCTETNYMTHFWVCRAALFMLISGDP